ncbi:multidrug efflux SMR transporter [Staphylococcus gallinarum]|jgi:paired small multidrug resistance pump|uniref:Membrane transporter n=1 Tax=Staphylococcus gallinarum TaxID=1293 RepID=A0A0D0SUA8_STAGA|nr:multidrug efflux SMR transporter [Staphylococcus gallinarum]KIR12624.1 transporter [Staphylococcus gallinarum]MDN6414209.1 multidrug efflux SMR transporter [Staphylococcus gallinarum]PTE38273.1 QacE family quaternary ammonium compound efflux SMR transporter [Staphylococcus gallinarum]PTE74945.1 QacE family quaternary ammonium compound efflux SMR transporter [Staphylococcus gallinarum]PTK89086.1 QacE family quaternary ammonium compound efflux SMR transporter [Staphylococcus gallinarum]
MMWIILVFAGIFEMLGINFLNAYVSYRKKVNLLMMCVTFILSFILLSVAMSELPMSTAYAVWTGIGAVGGTLLGMIFYKESKDIKRILCIVVILASTVGLKLLS